MYAGTPAAMRAFFCGLQKQFLVEHCVKSPQDGFRGGLTPPHTVIVGVPGASGRNQDYAVYQKRRYHPVQW